MTENVTTYGYGKRGADDVLRYFQSKNCSVEDVRNLPAFKKDDVSFVVTKPNGSRKTVSVKTDSKAHKSGNLFIETAMERKANAEGWYYYNHSDILCYYLYATGELLFIDWARLRRLCEEGKARALSFDNSTDKCTGRGYLVDIKRVLEDGGALIARDKISPALVS